MSKKTRPSSPRWHFRNPKLIVDSTVYQALERLVAHQPVDLQPSTDLPAEAEKSPIRTLVEHALQQFFDHHGTSDTRVIPLDLVPWSSSKARSVRISRALMTTLQQEARRQTSVQHQHVSVKRLAHAIFTTYLAEQADGRGSDDPLS